jgi:cyclophilin family peptidyl-prolyl cis-trans isomerase
VSVQRGNDSGFGFSIYPGKTAKSDTGGSTVIGKVIEGLDVIEDLNEFQVVKSSKVNYMALTGSDGMKSAPVGPVVMDQATYIATSSNPCKS